jgi:DNA-binding NarL/FixJ family response regulator
MARLRKNAEHESPVRILLLEDDARDADLITSALQRNAMSADVRRVDSADLFEQSLVEFEPDVVLSDRGVNGLSSLAALRMAREKRPDSPFIIVAGNFERSAIDSIRAGAADYVSKAELQTLPTAVHAALDQRAPLRRLSNRQREVFRLLAAGEPMREIARRLGLSRKTVETHRSQVMARLGLHHVTELVRLAIRLGVVSAEN